MAKESLFRNFRLGRIWIACSF